MTSAKFISDCKSMYGVLKCVDQYRERERARRALATARGTDPASLPIHAIANLYKMENDYAPGIFRMRIR